MSIQNTTTPAGWPSLPLALPPPRMTLHRAVLEKLHSPDWREKKTTIDPKPFSEAMALIHCAEHYRNKQNSAWWDIVYKFEYRRERVDEINRLEAMDLRSPQWGIEASYKWVADYAVEWIEHAAQRRSDNASLNAYRRQLKRGRLAA